MLRLRALATHALWIASLLPSNLAQSAKDNSALYHVPIGSPGFQHNHSSAAVTFDQHSLFLDGKRVFLYGGEYHPWRSPTGPVLWRDVLEKMKVSVVQNSLIWGELDAAGFSGISIYLHWGATAFTETDLDFKYFRSVTDFLDIAKSVGLLVTVRPGPYINAETNAGGFPGWLSNFGGTARTNASDYTEAWVPWITAVSKFIAPYQYPDGPVIAVQSENEFFTGTVESPYMQKIEDTFRANGLTKIPITYNDGGPSGNFATSGLGQVDMYGYDNYPLGFECSNPTVWTEVPTTYDDNHQSLFPATPMYIPEFQGGAFDFWGGPGYDNCYSLLNDEFANVYYKNLFSFGTSILSLYMIYGGTNWGNLATPVVYTSYDYGSPIREDRSLTTKYNEMKLQAHFVQSSPALLTVVAIGNGTVGSGTAYSNSSQIFTRNLRDPSTNTNFYFVRQTTNTNTSPVSFSLQTNTSLGTFTIPRYGGSITLAGRESKIIVTNYAFGSSKLVYSTAEVFTWTTIDGVDYLVLYAIAGQSIEAVISTSSHPTVAGSSTIKASTVNGTTVITGTTSGVAVVTVGSIKVLVVDKHTAYTFAQPRLEAEGYFNVGPATSSVLIYGPYLVREATLSGSTLSIVGDINATTTINVFAPKSVRSISWNGTPLSTKTNSVGALSATIAFKYSSIAALPSLTTAEWLCHDTLPEKAVSFDDSTWTVANKTSVLRPDKPIGGKYVLYADEYGYHQGDLLYRGHFTGKNATSLSLSLQGGFNFAYSAYINGNFLGSGQGGAQSVVTWNGGIDLLNATWALNPSLLNTGDNVVSVIVESTGLEEESGTNDGFKHPRGVRGYTLNGTDFTTWKVAGNYLGENFPDKVRGPLNEGGLWAERVGAHLPGYPATGWQSSKSTKSCSPFAGISSSGATAYRTKFTLNIPTDADVPVALKFTPTTDAATNTTSNYRAMIYINGWQFGRYSDNFGPQRIFPLPEGILNHRGENELLVTLWSLDPQGAKIAGLELITTAVVQSGKGSVPGIVTSPTYSELR
ncbi:glycoside hydrolase family 35 protein [Clavulina sp. PMI_390]|nr:glycoside hydrolase family 35 protein [Clavulina sp. PMI_390]